jgi:uncharacterized protein YbcC (UPF0753/DUF2309 family)
VKPIRKCITNRFVYPSVLINAPLPRIIDILTRNENLKSLLDNEWIYLMVMDPTDDNSIKTYQKEMQWTLSSDKKLVKKKELQMVVS